MYNGRERVSTYNSIFKIENLYTLHNVIIIIMIISTDIRFLNTMSGSSQGLKECVVQTSVSMFSTKIIYFCNIIKYRLLVVFFKFSLFWNIFVHVL